MLALLIKPWDVKHVYTILQVCECWVGVMSLYNGGLSTYLEGCWYVCVSVGHWLWDWYYSYTTTTASVNNILTPECCPSLSLSLSLWWQLVYTYLLSNTDTDTHSLFILNATTSIKSFHIDIKRKILKRWIEFSTLYSFFCLSLQNGLNRSIKDFYVPCTLRNIAEVWYSILNN